MLDHRGEHGEAQALETTWLLWDDKRDVQSSSVCMVVVYGMDILLYPGTVVVLLKRKAGNDSCLP